MPDEMKINNNFAYSKPKEKCPRCGISLNVRMVLHNTSENCKENITYPYMDIGESMHFECYMEHVMDTYLKNLIKKPPSFDLRG